MKLKYKDKPFVTVPMEIAAPEGGALANVDVVTVAVAELGFVDPTDVPCLSVRYQIAQKIHACTDPLGGERPNDRAHDLADLILLEELVDDADLAAVRDACVDVFAVRGRHIWPPALVAPAHWPALWDEILETDAVVEESLPEAVDRVRALIVRIDEAA